MPILIHSFKSLDIHDSHFFAEGGIVPSINAYDYSTITLTGMPLGILTAHDHAAVGLYSGIANTINMTGSSIADLWSGTLSSLGALNTSTVLVHGYDFVLGPGLSLNGNDVNGTGVLSGKWLSGLDIGKTFSFNITQMMKGHRSLSLSLPQLPYLP